MKFKIVNVLLLLILGLQCDLRAEFVVPILTGPVVDKAHILDNKVKQQLVNALRNLRETTGSQIQVLIVPDLGGITIEQASIMVVDKWQIGAKERDNGILLLVAMQERRMRIEVGRGFEGVLPDAYAKRIIDETMRPLFKDGKFGSGIIAGVYQIVVIIHPDINLKEIFGDLNTGNYSLPIKARGLVIFLVIFFFLLINRFGLGPLILLGLLNSRHGGGGWSGRGGGWSGGGGGFSGGGASGGW